MSSSGARLPFACRAVQFALAASFLVMVAGASAQGQADPAAPTECPAAYVVSFRMITVAPAEGRDPGEFGDVPSGAFFFAPDDGDGFYDRVKLAEAYGRGVREGLVATVGPVYSMSMKPNSNPVVVSGVTGDGSGTWSVSASVEPLTPDGKRVRLHSGWDVASLFGFEVPGLGTSDHWLGVPLPLHSGNRVGSPADGEAVGQKFRGGYTILVLIEKAAP
ncbi:MAG TPA: hypothetical protein PLD23_13800 [Armatimonadota bacterium]|nr:hypothetical protein [Armatimonadota bacterium]